MATRATPTGSLPLLPAAGRPATARLAARSVLALALALLGAAEAVARAAPADPEAAVLSVEVRGASDAKGELLAAVREAFSERMGVVRQAKVAAALAAEPEAGCSAGPCATRLSAARGARWLVRARAVGRGSDYDLEVAVTDGATGAAQPRLQDHCTLCGWAEVGVRLGALCRAAASVAATTPAPPSWAPGPPPQGPAPAAALREPTGSPSHPVRGLAVAKWATAVAALGLIGASVGLFAIDGKGTCTLPAGSEQLQCPRHYDTALAAGLLLGGGVLVGATSAGLFVLDARRARLTPTVRLDPGGASVGVALQF